MEFFAHQVDSLSDLLDGQVKFLGKMFDEVQFSYSTSYCKR